MRCESVVEEKVETVRSVSRSGALGAMQKIGRSRKRLIIARAAIELARFCYSKSNPCDQFRMAPTGWRRPKATGNELRKAPILTQKRMTSISGLRYGFPARRS